MELDTTISSLPVYEALASRTRLHIINLLGEKHSLNLTEIAEALNLSNPIITRHIQKLVTANLVRIEKKPGLSGIQKLVSLNIDDAHILFPGRVYPGFSIHQSEINLGLYSDYEVAPTCGLASTEHIIGKLDDPRYFSDNERTKANLLWFSQGYVEYSVPNPLVFGELPEVLELSLELSSEYRLSNNHWPSDITLTINGVEVGSYTVPGNFSDVRGKFTPSWWEDNLSQYGLLTFFRVSTEHSTADSNVISDITIEKLNLLTSNVITFRFSVKKDAPHQGGLTIFGQEFGNHSQNIQMKLYYSS